MAEMVTHSERFVAKAGVERVRIAVGLLNGTPVLDVRVFYGDFPTQRGVCVALGTGRRLALALADVLQDADDLTV
jgi:hypothetical protein